MMALVTERIENNILYLELNGRIDSSNAEQAETLINDIKAAHPGVPSVLDAEKLEYLSSTGLCVFLMMAKHLGGDHLFVDSAITLVREIFDTTGFSSVVVVR